MRKVQLEPGDELFSEGQLSVAVPTMKPAHPAGIRASKHQHRGGFQPMASQQYCFSLTMLKLELYSQVLAALPHVEEHFALFHVNKRFSSKQVTLKIHPYSLKDTGPQ